MFFLFDIFGKILFKRIDTRSSILNSKLTK